MFRRPGFALGRACALLVIAGCAVERGEPAGDDDGTPGEPGVPGEEAPFRWAQCGPARGPLPPLIEDRRVYAQDSLEVWDVHLTITDLEALAEVDAGVADAVVPVGFSEGTFGAGLAEPNAMLQLRGESSRRAPVKSYKVKLADGAGRWRGQREINLNKHGFDLTRVRNKLAFDLFPAIEHFTSLRTQFVHLFVNGADHGLYTWIEEADTHFLRSHGLDPDGQLYKASSFHFQDLLADVAADPAMLDVRIEPKANPDPAKLLAVVAAIHDPAVDPDATIDRYFNRDNLVTWLAVNVLLNNIDTFTHNYYLYSPSSCDGWYFLPWDYDGAWGFYGQAGRVDDRKRWQAGLSSWWPSHLFKRFLSRPANVAAVHARIAELADTVLTGEVTEARLAGYRDLVQTFITTAPDLALVSGANGSATRAVELWDRELTRITSTAARFRAEHEVVAERPMPVHLGATVRSSTIVFSWGSSFDLQHHPLTYDLEISRTPAFAPADLVVTRPGLVTTSATIPRLPAGTYYARVVIEDGQTADSWQLPYNPHERVVID